ncbi:MAG: BMP family protein [Chloroflexi bacterium]|nr:BMP family protein [Chloroflexota bacterium]
MKRKFGVKIKSQRLTAGVLLVAVILFGSFGCQPSSISSEGTSTQKHPFRVAILLPRSIEADGWTRSGYQGIVLIKKKLGADIAYSENVPENDFEKVFRQYALEGYDFIIGHGNQFIPAAEKVAAEFPQTDFAIAGRYEGNNINLGSLSLREGEMAYLLGSIAAIKTKTKHIGYLGGAENISGDEITALFERGAQAEDPSIQVSIDWVGDFTDAEKAQQLAQKQINSGVDVILVLAGSAGTDVHAQAEKAGIFTLGWIEDLNHLAPGAVITSNVQDVPQMLLAGATLSNLGRWEGKQYKFGLAEGIQNLAPFHGLLSPEQESRINLIKNDILTGEIDTLP